MLSHRLLEDGNICSYYKSTDWVGTAIIRCPKHRRKSGGPGFFKMGDGQNNFDVINVLLGELATLEGISI